MTWLTLRLLRPYLVVAAAVTAAATAGIGYAATVVQRQLDGAGRPDCLDPNLCYPHGGALDAVLAMELTAAFVPPLLGLIIGVGLFGREVEDDTVAFALTQSASRRRWVSTKFGWALGAGLVCSTIVAVAHRTVATRYTVLANDTYEGLQLLHLNNAAYQVAQTATVIVLAGLVGLVTGRPLRTLVVSVLAGPLVFLAAVCAAVLLAYPLALFIDVPEPATAPGGAANFAADMYTMDPLGYLTGAVVAAGVIVALLAAPRVAFRGSR